MDIVHRIVLLTTIGLGNSILCLDTPEFQHSMGEKLTIITDGRQLLPGTRSLQTTRTFFDRCLLAAQGMGAGIVSVWCGCCIPRGIADLSSPHLSLKESSPNNAWSKIATLSGTFLLISIALTTGGYSINRLKELFKGAP